MFKGYEYRIYPNKTQQKLIARTFGCCRFVYNSFLQERIQQYEQTKKYVNSFTLDLTRKIPSFRVEYELSNLLVIYNRYYQLGK